MGYSFFNIQKAKDSYNRKMKAFQSSLGASVCNGEDISFADNDISYILKLQHERIKEKGLTMDYEIYSRDETRNDFIVGSTWKDKHYESLVCSHQCGVKRTVKNNGRKCYKDNRKTIIYETITDVLTDSHPDDELVSCPNCGNVSKIAELTEGCPHCNTKYKMDDLFPKITSYYFIDDIGLAGSEGKNGILISTIIAAILHEFLYFIFNWRMFMPWYIIKNGFINQILGMFAVAILGVVIGYFGYTFFLVFRMFFIASSSSSGKGGTIGSRMKFENRMKKVSPEFSFEYFTSKAISLIKTAVYSKDERELLFYEGEALDSKMKDIIDMNYGAALGIVKFSEKDGYVTVVTKAFFDVLYAQDNKVYFKHKNFTATFKKRTDIPINMNFSMTRISCPTCGSSFDATKNKFCPYCGNEYELISDDWILVELKEN